MQNILFFALLAELKLEKPVRVFLSRKRPGYVAEYLPDLSDDGELLAHEITFYTPEIRQDERSFDVIMAHELIHAWQQEKGLQEIHGPHFRKMARKIGNDYGLADIYDPADGD